MLKIIAPPVFGMVTPDCADVVVIPVTVVVVTVGIVGAELSIGLSTSGNLYLCLLKWTDHLTVD